MGNFFISHLRDPKTMCISRLDLSMSVPNSHLKRLSSFREIVQIPTLLTEPRFTNYRIGSEIFCEQLFGWAINFSRLVA